MKKKNKNFINDKKPVKDRLVLWLRKNLETYPTPLNLNFTWSFGFLAGIVFVIQVLSGLALASAFSLDPNEAFNSLKDHIVRNMPYGWLWHNTHKVGASFFFIVVFLHMAKAIYYRGYKRKKLWFSGLSIYFLLMAIAFTGYSLPNGQMSFWGLTVVINFFSSIPDIGPFISKFIWGGSVVNQYTAYRIGIAHYALPVGLAVLIILHLYLLHIEGSTNPLSSSDNIEKGSFYPYFIYKDLVLTYVFLSIFIYYVFFFPNRFSHPENNIPADPLVTPREILPEWYFYDYFQILKCFENKEVGLILMVLSIACLFILPFLDKTPLEANSKFSYLHSIFFWIFIMSVIMLGWLSTLELNPDIIVISRYCIGYYFIYMVVILPKARVYETYINRFFNNLKNKFKKK